MNRKRLALTTTFCRRSFALSIEVQPEISERDETTSDARLLKESLCHRESMGMSKHEVECRENENGAEKIQKRFYWEGSHFKSIYRFKA